MKRITLIFASLLAVSSVAGFTLYNINNQKATKDIRGLAGGGQIAQADAKSGIKLPEISDILEMGEEGLKSSQAKILIANIERAQDHGLKTIDLSTIKSSLDSGKRLDETQKQALINASIKFGQDMNGGRINWKNARLDWDMRPAKIDVKTSFDAALANDGLDAWFKSLSPQHDAYLALMGARHLYVDAIKNGGFIKLNAAVIDAAALRNRLNQEGYNIATPTAPNVFDEALKEKLKLFQKAHALKQSGELNEDTFAALNVSAEDRLKQIDLNLERERWVPRNNPKTRIEANITNQMVIYFENGQPALEMPSIVGAVKTKTPMLASEIRGVVFNPSWYKPASIKGKSRVQPPGPRNALGRVKFDMANDHAVFLHDTPNHGLFSASRRTLSHGCVRLHKPKDLAEILTKPEGYDRERIDKITSTSRTHWVKLNNKTPVLLLYRTAYVDYSAKDGSIVHFPRDVYEWDPLLTNLIEGRANIAQNTGSNGSNGKLNVAAP